MKERGRAAGRGIGVLAAALLVGAAASGCTFEKSQVSLLEGWQYRWGDSPRDSAGRLTWLDPANEPEAWKPFTPPRRPDAPRSSEVMWARVELPADLPPQAAAAFVFIDQAFEAYVGGQLVYSHGKVGESTLGLGRPAQLFSLGEQPAGRQLVLRIYSTAKSIGIAGDPRVGPPTRLAGAHLRAHPALSISTFLTLGLALVVFLLFAFIPSDRELPLIGALAFLAGFYTVISGFSPIKPLLGIEPSPQLALGTLFIIPAVYCDLCARVLGRRLMKWLAIVMFVFFAGSLLGSMVGLFSMYDALAIYRVYAPASMILGIALAAVDTARRKQQAWIFLIGFSAILFASARDAMLDARVVAGETMWLSWGLVIAFIGHGVSALRRYALGMVRAQRLGEEVDRKSAQLQQARTRVVEAAAGMRDKAGDIAASVGNQLADARQQAETLARSRSDALHIAETSKHAADEAHAVSVVVQRSEELSAEGQRSVERTTQAMLQLAGQVGQITQVVELLSTDAERITEVMRAAQEVADQSKMLAINAALEAARAGESGQGFAVVAREIHALADRSMAATRQVKKLLTDVGGRTEVASAAAASGLKLASETTELAKQTGASIEGLGAVVREASGVARGIEAQAREQVLGVEGVVAALDAASASVDGLLRSAAEVREAADSVRGFTEELSRTVGDEGAAVPKAGAAA